MTESSSIIGAHWFFRGLPAEYVDRIASAATHVKFPAHYRLFDEGMTAQKFWLIDAGQVALDALVPGDGRVIIETLGRGEVVGLSWLQPPYQFRYGAFATQPLQAFEFDGAAVRAACDEDPALGYALVGRFMAVASHRLQATRARLLESRSAAA